ncbi:MAG: DUF881 domain-containing protein [Actinomycetes bacterium]
MESPSGPPRSRTRGSAAAAATTTTDRGTARPDASMTLLTEVMQRPLDPGYAAAAQRREQGDGVRSPRRLTLTVLLAAVAGGLLVAAVLQLRLPGQSDSRTLLMQEIGDRTTQVDDLEQEVAALQSRIDEANASALSGPGQQLLARAEELGAVTGAAPVTGPGVTVSMNDAESLGKVAGADPRELEKAESGRVRDRDLQVVVNGLWASGAEAVSVNDQRLTALSSIRQAGAAVLVNFRPLTPPYEVSAVGDPQKLQVAFASSAAGRYLTSLQQNYGVRASVSAADRLELPGASGLRLHYAHPVEPAAPTPPATNGEPAAPAGSASTPTASSAAALQPTTSEDSS